MYAHAREAPSFFTTSIKQSKKRALQEKNIFLHDKKLPAGN